MKIKTAPIDVFSEYKKGRQFNYSIDLYDNIRRNENFFIGKQWEGVRADNLDKPIFNIIKRIGNTQIANIVSDDIGVSLRPYFRSEDALKAAKIVETEIDRIIERTKVKKKNRDALKNAYKTGDAAIYVYFDARENIGQISRGAIKTELFDAEDIYFGNPADSEVEKQPYIIVARRDDLSNVQERAYGFGCARPDDIESIKADSESENYNDELHDNLVTVLTKFWKNENGEVYSMECTDSLIIRMPYNTGCRLYPIAFMNWEKVKNSYHGQAAVTGLIPNQVAINKTYAMLLQYVKYHALPKMLYDKTKILKFNNRIGEAIGVNGPITDAITGAIKMPDMDSMAINLLNNFTSLTQETLGASDATLGNIRPDNAAAIVATQQATSAPLELVKQNFYQFIEDYIKIFVDIMRTYYGVREVETEDESGRSAIELFDFSSLGRHLFDYEVNIGASTYWSEVLQTQTSSNLLQAGVITDPEIYLESVPDKYIKNKSEILKSIRENKQRQEEMQNQMSGGANAAQNIELGDANAGIPTV